MANAGEVFAPLFVFDKKTEPAQIEGRCAAAWVCGANASKAEVWAEVVTVSEAEVWAEVVMASEAEVWAEVVMASEAEVWADTPLLVFDKKTGRVFGRAEV